MGQKPIEGSNPSLSANFPLSRTDPWRGSDGAAARRPLPPRPGTVASRPVPEPGRASRYAGSFNSAAILGQR